MASRGRPCSVCKHPAAAEINRAIIAGEMTQQEIGKKFKVSQPAISTHKRNHLASAVVAAQVNQATVDGTDVLAEMDRLIRRARHMVDACHDWLLDPEDGEKYSLMPRSHEVDVIWDQIDEDGKRFRRRSRLDELLARVEGPEMRTVFAESKIADTRELMLKSLQTARAMVQSLAALEDGMREAQVKITVTKYWIAFREAVTEVLRELSEKQRESVVAALRKLDGEVMDATSYPVREVDTRMPVLKP